LSAGAASKLLVAQQPATATTSGELLATQPKVQLQDAAGNTVATAGVPVMVELVPSTGWSLQGTTTLNTNASGVADFTDLRIVGPSGTVALRFTSGSLTAVNSQDIAVSAATTNVVSWTNAAGGNWSTGSNWSTGAPPTSAEAASITLAGTYAVTLDVNTTIAGLTLGASSGAQTLAGTSRTLTVNGNSSIGVNGTLSLVSSTIGGTGTLANLGSLVLQAGTVTAGTTIANEGLLLTHGTSSISGPVTTTASSVIRIRGQSAGSTASTTIANGFTNNGLIELTTNDAGFTVSLTVTTGTLTNAAGATIRSAVGQGGARTLAVQLANAGTLDVLQPLTLAKAGAAHTNSAAISLSTANLTVTQTGTTPSFTNTGPITLAASRDLIFSGGLVDLSAGTVSGTVTSTLIVSGATLAFSTATVTIPMTLTTTTIQGGSVTIPSGETLTLLGGGLSDPVTIQAGGTLLTHGTVSLTGAVSMPSATSTLRVRGQSNGSTASTTIANGFTNNGLIELTTNDAGFTVSLTVTTGTLTNAAGGTIRSEVGQGGARTLAVQLNNIGTLELNQPLTLAKADAAHTNSGSIDMSLGLTTANLTVTQTGTTPSFTNTGSITLAASRDLIFSGGTVDLSAGTVSGQLTSTLVVSGATLAFSTATVTIPMTLTTTTIQGGSVTIPSGETLTLLGGGLSDPVTIQAGGTLLTHGTVSLTGAISMPSSTSTLRVRGQSNGSTASTTIANGFTNNGLIELTTNDAGFSVTLAVTTGTLTNNFGGIIRSSVGAGGARTLAAQLANSGTLDVDQNLTLAKADAAQYNANFIDLTNADLTITQTGTSPSFGNGISGNITLGASRSLTVNGGAVNLTGSSVVSGPASALVTFSGVVLDMQGITGSARISGMSVRMTGGTTILGGTLLVTSPQPMTLINSTVSDAVTVQSGAILTTLGTTALNGALSVQSSGTRTMYRKPSAGHVRARGVRGT
jgi:hypothetical protein